MIRISTMMIASMVLLAGCGQGEFELTSQLDTSGGDAVSSVNTPAPKSQIVRALLQAIDEIKGESPEVKEELRRSLLAADDELAQVLGDSREQLIANLNEKPPVAMIGQPDEPSARTDAGEKTSSGILPSSVVQTKRRAPDPADDESDEPKTRMIKALLEALADSEGDDDDTRDELRTTLIDADKQLRQVLGGQSKRLIEAANRKPPIPIVGGCPKGEVKKKATVTSPKAKAASFRRSAAPATSDAPAVPTASGAPADPATPAADPSGEPKTKIVKALIEAIEQIEDEDGETNHDLRQSLMQADSELSHLLGGNSKRLIEQANKKPPVPVVGGPCPPRKKPDEKKTTEKE